MTTENPPFFLEYAEQNGLHAGTPLAMPKNFEYKQTVVSDSFILYFCVPRRALPGDSLRLATSFEPVFAFPRSLPRFKHGGTYAHSAEKKVDRKSCRCVRSRRACLPL